MLERLVEQRWVVSAVLADEKAANSKSKATVPDLTPGQWDLAVQLLDVLRPFKAATTFLSAQNNVSVSCVLPIVYQLQQKLTVKRKEKQAVRDFRTRAMADLNKQWSLDQLQMDSIPVLASALDPRFKDIPVLSAGEVQGVVKAVGAKCEEMASRGDVQDEGSSQTQSAATAETSAKRAKTVDALEYLFGPENLGDNDTIESEVARYFADPVQSRGEDPLQWWKENCHRFHEWLKLLG